MAAATNPAPDPAGDATRLLIEMRGAQINHSTGEIRPIIWPSPVSNIQINDVQIMPATPPKPTAKPKSTLTLKRNAWLQQKPAED
jgi:hypothetical protein